MERLNGAIDDILITLGSRLAPILTIIADSIVTISEKFGQFSDLLSGGGLDTNLGELATTLGLVATGVILVGAAAAAWSYGVGLLSAGFTALGISILPILAPILAVIAIFYAFKSAYDNNLGGFKDFMEKVFDGAAVAINKFITETLPRWTTEWTATWEMIKLYAQEGWDFVKGIFEAATTILIDVISFFFELLTGKWQEAWDAFVILITDLWNIVKAIFTPALEFIRDLFVVVLDSIKTTILGWVENVKKFFRELWTNVKTIFTDGLESARLLITNFIPLAGEIFWKIGVAMSSAIDIAWKGIKATISDGINWIIDKVNGLIRSINSAVGSLGIKIPEIPRVAFAKGGMVEGANFAMGGVVSGPSGIDKVPAMLSAGEVVLNAAQQSNVARRIENGGEGMTIVVNINGNSFYGDDEAFAEKIGDTILAQFRGQTAIYGL